MNQSLAKIDARLDHFGDAGPSRYTIDVLAAETGLPVQAIAEIWQALGRPELDEGSFNDADRRTVNLAADLAASAVTGSGPAVDTVGLRPVLRTLRAATHALRRLSDAHVTARLEQLHAGEHDLIGDVDLNADTVESLVVELWRHELRQSLARALSTIDDPTNPLLAVGFVDLAGYSARSQQLATADLIELVDRFDATTLEVATAHGATIVKTIGDEVMFVHTDPTGAARVALELLERCSCDELMLAARAGIAWGRPVALGGDYYGPSVNLAARLVQLARPCAAIVDAALAALLEPSPDLELGPMRPQRLRHCGTHAIHTLRRRAVRD